MIGIVLGSLLFLSVRGYGARRSFVSAVSAPLRRLPNSHKVPAKFPQSSHKAPQGSYKALTKRFPRIPTHSHAFPKYLPRIPPIFSTLPQNIHNARRFAGW